MKPILYSASTTMTDKQRETAMKKLQEGAHFHSSSDMNADMSTEAADMVVLAVDKYIPTQNWEVSYQSSKIELCRAAMLPLLNAYCCIECRKKKNCPSKRMSGFFFEEHAQLPVDLV